MRVCRFPTPDITITSIPITAKVRKLRTKWTLESQKDLTSVYSVHDLTDLLEKETKKNIDEQN